MAAPKNPNVTNAAASRRRIGDETAATRLHAAGWFLVTPELADAVRAMMNNSWDEIEWTPGQNADAR